MAESARFKSFTTDATNPDCSAVDDVLRVHPRAEPPFALRGYYVTFMRMPAFGLAEWKQMVDCIQDDGGNMLLQRTAGGLRSKHFPETSEYNADHKKVQSDFVRELIDYAHKVATWIAERWN
jgi:hypothetical protein